MAKEQLEIPGTESPKIPAVTKAARQYVEARDARQDLTKKEVACRDVLVKVMKDNKLAVYRFDDQMVTLSEIIKPKVKTVVDDGESEGEPEADE